MKYDQMMKRIWRWMVVLSGLLLAGCGQAREESEQYQVDGKQWVEVRRVGNETHLISKTIEEKGGGVVVEMGWEDPILVVNGHPKVSVEKGGIVVLKWDDGKVERHRWSDLEKRQRVVIDAPDAEEIKEAVFESIGPALQRAGN